MVSSNSRLAKTSAAALVGLAVAMTGMGNTVVVVEGQDFPEPEYTSTVAIPFCNICGEPDSGNFIGEVGAIVNLEDHEGLLRKFPCIELQRLANTPNIFPGGFCGRIQEQSLRPCRCTTPDGVLLSDLLEPTRAPIEGGLLPDGTAPGADTPPEGFGDGTTTGGETSSTNLFGQYLPAEGILSALLNATAECVPDLYQAVVSGTEGASNNNGGSTGGFFSNTPAPTAGNQILTALNDYFTNLGQNTCSDTDTQAMLGAMEEFRTCTGGLDMKVFVQLLPSAMTGMMLKCGLSVAATEALLDPSFFETALTDGEYELPDDCVEAMIGSNPMGDMFRMASIQPDTVFNCMSEMSDAIPDCRYYEFPFPIVGAWLRAGTCFAGSFLTVTEQLCEAELQTLDDCLPSPSTSATQDCAAQRESCAEAGALSMTLMKPLLGAPMPDTCVRIAGAKNLKSALDKYQAFAAACTTPWDGWDAPVGAMS